MRFGILALISTNIVVVGIVATIIFHMIAKREILTNLLETSEMLGISAKWLKDAAIGGEVPCLFIGKRQMLFYPKAVEEAMVILASKKKKMVET